MALLACEGMASPLAGPFDLTLAAGEAIAISGPSGAGKSLFLRMLADLDPNQGGVWLNGVARSAIPAPEWRRRVAYLPADSGWWRPDIAGHFAPGQRAEAAALAARLLLDAALLEAPVARLSTGERSRLALIRALLGAPAVLLADEPTGALDPAATAAVEALLGERREAGLGLILVSHDPAQGDRLGARRRRIVARRFAAEEAP
ncbi:MAG: ATP-binding cassette domain-containing protein [Rhodospirillales bacterium]|nr:ATP-binding cassette domain-containing protein [Rhodospirillales bacterium]